MSYYRIVYRDQNDNVIGRSAVDVSVEPGVETAPAPKFTSESVVNAGSYFPGSLAPCQLVSIFGSQFGASECRSHGPIGRILSRTLSRIRVCCLIARLHRFCLYTPTRSTQWFLPQSHSSRSPRCRWNTRGKPPNRLLWPWLPLGPGSSPCQAAPRVQSRTLTAPRIPRQIQPRVAAIYSSLAHPGGPTVPPCEDAAIVKDARHLQLPMEASIGGWRPVSYAGAAPSFVTGVTQFNILIPEAAPTGDAVELLIRVGGAQSQGGVTVAVK